MGLIPYMASCINILVSGKNKGITCSRKATMHSRCTQHYKKFISDSDSVPSDSQIDSDDLWSSSSGVLLANNFFDNKQKPNINPIGWWFSEKFDGIRAIWTGKHLISRTGKIITAPLSFLSLLPSDVSLDGELFTSRGDFSLTSSIVSKKIPLEHEWKNIIFHIFDIPHLRSPFEHRIDFLQLTVKHINSPQIQSVIHTKITSYLHLISSYDLVILKKGEGLMLRKPLSLYDPKRSHSLLKVKMFQDSDAIVIGYKLGSGRLQHALGSLIVKWSHDHSVVFHVGSGLDDLIRFGDYSSLLPLGSIISVKFFELDSSSHKPRFPIFLAKRFEQSTL
jgi:DNA ligase-1